ncbi:Predicted PurR-regulated permease PerM [Belliella buryatensis]|uniref:Predicted PurR-regulated permease PerM n=1 Tax=Belliella buryatensis TaxID=1500549 RepID=A0A239C0N9_9BACT|nr:AI-2E family transporter [Belliella buryatensis]SNS13807.1 Predicted PurR-regulated permease PerM [Belliella buryatensis]
MNSLEYPKSQKIFFTLASLVLIIWIMKAGAVILIPLVWGAFFAFALYPLANWLEERKIPRALAIALTLALVTSLAASVLYVLTDQVIGLITDIPEIKTSFEAKVSSYFEQIEALFGLEASLTTDFDFFSQSNLEATLVETGKSLVLLGVIPLFIFLMLYYKDFFWEFLKKLSRNNQPPLLDFIKDSGAVIQSYLLGMLMVTGIVSVMSGIVFYFLGIKYFILFAVFIAVMNLIPYVGVILSSLLLVLYVLLTTDSLFYPLATLLLLWLIQLIENNLITPVVVGAKVRVNALAVILAILLGGFIWGVSGMILFIPMTGLLKIIFERIPSLAPYGYLLGDEYPVIEKHENYFKMLFKRKAK